MSGLLKDICLVRAGPLLGPSEPNFRPSLFLHWVTSPPPRVDGRTEPSQAGQVRLGATREH